MKIDSEQEMLDFGETLGKKLLADNDSAVIELIGDVGVGKTTFTRGLAKGLKIKKPVTSPSFTVSKTYSLPNNKFFTHYDFYRLQDPGIMEEDLKEKISEGGIIVIEWGNSIKNILPDNRIIIRIKLKDGYREATVEDNRFGALQDISQPTGSELARDPVATSATKRVEKGAVQLYLDTSTPTTILKLNDKTYEWNSGRDLAENLLKFIRDKLAENGKTWQDLTEITFMSGPGSFTGLRIGAAVVNALAHELNIPLKNHKGETVKIIVPDYGADANISQPRK